MTLRKTAGFLAAAGLIAGLLGSGVGASFVDSLTATENISVGSFSCYISDATSGSVYSNYIGGHPHAVTYTAPKILSSAAGSAPFKFTVLNAGDIAMNLHITAAVTSTTVSTFTNIPAYDQQLNPSESWQFEEGLSWPNLVAGDMGKTASVTYTASCDEVTALTYFGPAPVVDASGTFTITSTGSTYSMYGVTPDWGGFSVPGQSGKLLPDLNLSFDASGGDINPGSPRWSIPISEDGSTWSGAYAFIGANDGCVTSAVGTASPCMVSYGATYTDWDSFAAAHPTWSVAPGFTPLIVADGYNGTYVIKNITY